METEETMEEMGVGPVKMDNRRGWE